MRARDADLGTLWESGCYRYEQKGRRVPPWYWRLFHRVVQEILGRMAW